MECPNCHNGMIKDEEASHGMGNQAIYRCFGCGLIVLCSGEVMTQIWHQPNAPTDDAMEGVRV